MSRSPDLILNKFRKKCIGDMALCIFDILKLFLELLPFAKFAIFRGKQILGCIVFHKHRL